MVLVYMLTFTINIPQMLAYIPAPWILCVMIFYYDYTTTYLWEKTHVAVGTWSSKKGPVMFDIEQPEKV